MSKRFWLTLAGMVFVLAMLGFLRVSSFKETEQGIIAQLQASQSPNSILFFQLVSDTISFVSLGIPALFVLAGWIRKNPPFIRKGVMIMLSIALAGTICATIKRTVREPRPYEVDARIKQWSVGGSNSFPSGHTAEVSAAALAFSFILFRTPTSIILSVVWALLMMLSRIVLGVHNFTDIMGGFVAGCIGLYVMNAIFTRFEKKKAAAVGQAE
jgi:membrane-associated phospholipid phosphatase